jgi:hypothetical protein
MEYWFARAINGNPLNYEACSRKLTYLLPQWFGSADELLDFGRSVAAKYNGRLPLILVDCHINLRALASDQSAYMQQTAVWADIQSAYEKVLDEKTAAHSPDVPFDRAKYLKFAADCQQWDDFTTLAAKFGDDIDLKAFGGKALLDFYKKKAAAATAKNPT